MTADDQSDIVLEYKTEGARRHESCDYRDMDWKGLGDAAESPVATGGRDVNSKAVMDMTPMVDVTFLLLIFFMVTASFTLQKSMMQPPSNVEGAAGPVEPFDISVLIDQNNMYYVSLSDEEFECPSEREMRTRVNEARKLSDVDRMTIRAHIDSTHKKVVSAWDAGVVAGIEKISIETTEEEL